MESVREAVAKLQEAWPHIVQETRLALGSELFYQAMVYHCLRGCANVPVGQLGMNVKMRIMNPVSELFKKLDSLKHENYRGGFEPIPDVCLFSSDVQADWRRRNREKTLASLLVAIEIKASEREGARLRTGEIITDIEKLAAHKEEALARGTSFCPVMMIIDTAPNESERMTQESLRESQAAARALSVGFMYASPQSVINTLESGIHG
jgi:hypothetical protein